MATISMVIGGLPGGLPDVTATWSLGSTEAGRMLAYLTAQYGIDDNGDPRTPSDTVTAAAEKIVNGIMENTARYEQALAKAQYVDVIVPPVATLQE